jgi:multiple sugar transport system permease protein
MENTKQSKAISRSFRERLTWLLVPAMAIPLLIGVTPFFLGIGLSFTNWRLSLRELKFAGLSNYLAIFSDPTFWHAIGVTLRFSGLSLLAQMTLGISVGYLLSINIKGISFFRSIILIPLMVAPVLSALMWKLMLPEHGVINYMLSWLGIKGVSWLSNPRTALLSVIGIETYIWTPFVAIVALAGFQALPKAPYEAAAVDGASRWFVLKRITFPLMRPLLLLALIFRFILSFKSFEVIYATTAGGPGNMTTTLHLWSYINTFTYGQGAKSTAAILILFAAIFFVSNRLIKYWVKSVEYQ